MSFERIFDESHDRVAKAQVNGRNFFQAFYENFLQTSPQIADKFKNTDMEKQQKLLKKSFYHLLVFYASNHADDYLEKIAIGHSQRELDIRPEWYELWLDSLINTLAEFDPDFNDSVELA